MILRGRRRKNRECRLGQCADRQHGKEQREPEAEQCEEMSFHLVMLPPRVRRVARYLRPIHRPPIVNQKEDAMPTEALVLVLLCVLTAIVAAILIEIGCDWWRSRQAVKRGRR